eukprot:3937109-Amphidinium_carterae.1
MQAPVHRTETAKQSATKHGINVSCTATQTYKAFKLPNEDVHSAVHTVPTPLFGSVADEIGAWGYSLEARALALSTSVLQPDEMTLYSATTPHAKRRRLSDSAAVDHRRKPLQKEKSDNPYGRLNEEAGAFPRRFIHSCSVQACGVVLPSEMTSMAACSDVRLFEHAPMYKRRPCLQLAHGLRE